MPKERQKISIAEWLGRCAWIVALVGVGSTVLAWLLWRPCGPAFLAGYFLAAAVVYVICKIVRLDPFGEGDGPSEPPASEDLRAGPARFRLIHCGPDKHLKRLRVRVKHDPQPGAWIPPEPEPAIELPIEPNLLRGQWRGFDPYPEQDVFGVWARVESVDPNGENPTWTDVCVYESDEPIPELTFRFGDDEQLTAVPRLLDQCGP